MTLFLVPACGGGGGGGGGGGPQPDPDLVPDVGASRFTVTPGFGTPSDGSTTVDIEFELINLRGRPLVGAQVELEVSGHGNVLQPLPPSDAQGRTRGTLASVAGERKSIRASTMSGGVLTEFVPRTTEFLQIPDNAFFVRVSGSDARSGRSPREAWQTLGHALLPAGAGATIHVGASVRPGPITVVADASGTLPLVLAGDRSGMMTGDPGEVVIDGGGGSWALRLLESRNVVLQGLTFRGGVGGLRIEDSSDVRVIDCRAYDNQIGIAVEGTSDLVVQDCRVSANQFDGVWLRNVHGARLENNIIYANLDRGLVLFAPSEQTVVRFNTFYRNGTHHILEEGVGGTGGIVENILSEGGADPLALLVGTNYVARLNLDWGNEASSQSDGLIQGDPTLVDPFGRDGILGGAGAEDDDFRVQPVSVANDLGALLARDVVLGSRESLATRTTRVDDQLEASGDDQPGTNLGYHAQPPKPGFFSLPEAGARIAHALPGDVRVHPRSFDPAAPTRTEDMLGPLLEAEIVFLEQRVSPLGTLEELLAAQVNTGTQGRIVVRHWDGRRWNDPALAPFQNGIPLSEIGDRRFDVEYETVSGRALLVLADGDGIPAYQVLTRGSWSAPQPVAADATGAGKVRVVELVARPGTNEIALVTVDDLNDLVVMLWDGAGFGAPRLLETNTLFVPSWRPFDAEFESLSGDLLVGWGFSVFAEELRFATLERASGEWRTGQLPNADATAAQVEFAADPTSDRIAAAMGEGSVNDDVTVSMWNGSEFVHSAELTLQGPIENRLLEAVWIGDTGIACVVFRRRGNTGSFNFALFLAPGWRIQPDVVLPGVDLAAKVRLASLPGGDELLGAVLDREGRLFGLRFDGLAFSLLDEGEPIATGIDPDAPGRPFDAAAAPSR